MDVDVSYVSMLKVKLASHAATIFGSMLGGGPREVVSPSVFHAGIQDLFPGLRGLEETKMFLPHPL